MKAQTSIRINASQKLLFQRAAALAHEGLTEFLTNSAMLRIQNRQLGMKPQDPMEVVGTVFLEPYDPAKVTRADAMEIEEINDRAAMGKLSGPVLGYAKVHAPKRTKA